MKKLVSFILVFLIVFGLMQQGQYASAALESMTKSITLKIGSPVITINGKAQPLDGVPVIENGRTLVPLRAIFEALSLKVSWDSRTQEITGTRGNTKITLYVGSEAAYKNDAPMAAALETPPKIINGRTMVPVRFLAESLGAEVKWLSETQTIVITEDPKFLSLKDITIYIGDPITRVESLLGKPDRIDPSEYDFNWHVYNSDYSRFIMVGIKDGIVEALYSNSKGFATNNAKYGDVITTEEWRSKGQQTGIDLYMDRSDNDGNHKIHACRIISDDVTLKDKYAENDEFYKAQELENFDATNAFRVNHQLKPLAVDDIAVLTARKHSQDMADKNYFNHTNLEGLSPWDRYKNNGGQKASGSGENISAGRLLGIDAFDGWVNSEGHRKNMLGSHEYLGVGYGYNQSSTYRYYMTQFFSR